jgi:hypothetical protein
MFGINTAMNGMKIRTKLGNEINSINLIPQRYGEGNNKATINIIPYNKEIASAISKSRLFFSKTIGLNKKVESKYYRQHTKIFPLIH